MILVADARHIPLADGTVQAVITSPPYWGLRDYGMAAQIGREDTPEGYVAEMVSVFREVRRVLRNDGMLWLNLGDKYDARKQLLMIPARLALALQADGWLLRARVIWHKPNPMPGSFKDRPTVDYEDVMMLTKRRHYYYDERAIREPAKDWGTRRRGQGKYTSDALGASKALVNGRTHGGLVDGNFAERGRNCRSVWRINVQPYPGAHFAVMPEALVEPCILASSRVGDLVLDPFCGSGTVGVVAGRHGRPFVGLELNPVYAAMAEERIAPHTGQGVLAL